MKQTPEEHKKRHKDLHSYFDELLADYIRHHPEQLNFLQLPIGDLMNWSFNQTLETTEVE